jgi:tetratricopeptide (TPR) repeat protein
MAVLLFAAALLAKPSIAAMPALLLILDGWPLRRLSWRAVIEKAPFLAAALASVIVTGLGEARLTGGLFYGHHGGGAIPLVFCHNVVFYATKIIWPIDLTIWYPFPEPLGIAEPSVLAGVIGTGLLAVGLIVSLRWTRALLAGWLFFAVGFFMTIGGVVRVGDMVAAHRFIYFPIVGLLMLVAWGFAWLWRPPGAPSVSVGRFATLAVVMVLAGLASAQTRRSIAHWRDTVTLHRHLVALAPSAPKLQNGLGSALMESGRPGEAVKHLEEAIRLDRGFAEPHYNLGNVRAAEGEFGAAIAHYEEASRLNPDDPLIRVNVGNALLAHGDTKRAFEAYSDALRLRPGDPRVHYNLAGALAQLGDLDKAIRHYQAALEARPNDADTHNNLAVVFSQRRLFDDALRHYQAALQLQPEAVGTLANLAWLRATNGDSSIRDPAAAIRLAEQACRLAGAPNPRLLDILASAYAAAGHYPRAVEAAEAALQIVDGGGAVGPLAGLPDRLQLYRAGRPFVDQAGPQSIGRVAP